MLYVATTGTMGALGEVKGLSESDSSVLFYKESDTCKMADLKSIMALPIRPEFIEISDRDDMLIQLGGLFVSNDDMMCFLDTTIPVPKRYEDRVTFDGAKKPAKKRSAKRSAKVKVEEKSEESVPENSSQKSGDTAVQVEEDRVFLSRDISDVSEESDGKKQSPVD